MRLTDVFDWGGGINALTFKNVLTLHNKAPFVVKVRLVTFPAVAK